jgi:Zn-dependent protease with chaperone function
MVIEHRDPAAWCLPGTRRPVVITTGAISALSREQLAAVLAHERAHQRGRHHLLVALAASLAAAFPYVPAFRQGREQVARLVELLADDAATTAIPRLTVAEALLALAAPVPAPALALAAGGSATGARIRRLAAAPAPLSRPAAMAGRLAISALIAIPLLVLAGPAIAAIAANCCHHADFPAIAARQLPPTGLPAPGGTR